MSASVLRLINSCLGKENAKFDIGKSVKVNVSKMGNNEEIIEAREAGRSSKGFTYKRTIPSQCDHMLE